MTGAILDTNVLSEGINLEPAPEVAAWWRSQRSADLFTTTTVIAEIVAGIELLPAGRRRSQLDAWLTETVLVDFRGRILDFDLEAAQEFGALHAKAVRVGRRPGVADTQIAAVASRHGLAVATRDIDDFRAFGVALIDPWAASDPEREF